MAKIGPASGKLWAISLVLVVLLQLSSGSFIHK